MSDDKGLSLNTTSYEFDFFAGSMISIYLGDILVDDVQYIQFEVTQTKRPVYGYASQYFHTVASGQVLVEGVFTVPFKEADYILATLQHYRTQQAPIHMGPGEKEYKALRESIERYMESQKKFEEQKAIISSAEGFGMSREGIDKLRELAPEVNNPYDFYKDLAALPDDAFENAAENFEDHLWGKTGNAYSEYTTGNLSVVPGGEDIYTHRRGDQYPPFDIWILYGDISNAEANHTIKKIIGANIVGQGQAISSDGQPILEQYRFIAKNLT